MSKKFGRRSKYNKSYISFYFSIIVGFISQNFLSSLLTILFWQVLSRLKVLNLKNSKFLTKIPNFSQVPALEILILEGCTSLVELHESIGNLKRLVLLNLEGCQNLRNLPGSISNLKSLQILNLSGCVKLDKLPEQLGNMMALKKLHADKTAITQLPASFCLLKNLETVSLSGCKGQSSKSLLSRFSSWISLKSSSPTHLLPTSISGLCSLTRLNLNDCNLSEDGFPIDLGCLSSLENLDIGRNNFLILPHCIGHLPKLTRLYLSGCTSLQSILELPKSLIELDARDCNLSEDGFPIDFGCLSSLMVLDIGRNNFFNLPHCIGRLSKLNHLTLKECSSLQSISELPASLLSLDARGCTSIETLPNLSNLKSSRDLDFANCQKLVEIQGLESLETTPTIYLENCNNLAYNFRRSLLSQVSLPHCICVLVQFLCSYLLLLLLLFFFCNSCCSRVMSL
jgi:Leucine-rich repeat (LRR) protein